MGDSKWLNAAASNAAGHVGTDDPPDEIAAIEPAVPYVGSAWSSPTGIGELREAQAEIAELRSTLGVAKGIVAELLGVVEDLNSDGLMRRAHVARRHAVGFLSEPANAEGIASEGGSAANPRDLASDAPSAEAGQPTAFEKVADYIVPYHDATAQHSEEPHG